MIRNIMGKHEATACKPRASGDDPVMLMDDVVKDL